MAAAMPIYEYRREDGTTFEVLESIHDAPLTKDPETGQKVERMLFAPAVHFKGKGFYNTNYGTKNRQRELKESAKDGADKNDAKAAEKKDDKKSDKKADSKPASSSSSSD